MSIPYSHMNLLSLLDKYKISNLEDLYNLSSEKEGQFALEIFDLVWPLVQEVKVDDSCLSPYLRFLHFVDNSISLMNFSQIVKRSCLYSGHTFFIENTPFNYFVWLNDEGTFSQKEVSGNYHTLLERIVELKPLLEIGEVSIFPGSVIQHYDGHHFKNETVEMNLVKTLLGKRFIPLLRKQKVKKLTRLFQKDLYLPYLKDIKIEELVKIKKNETDAFIRFQHKMDRIISELKDKTNEEKFRHLMEEVDYEIRVLNNEFKKVKNLRSLQRVSAGFFVISIVVFFAGFEDLHKIISLLLGAKSLSSVVEQEQLINRSKLDLRNSDFFIPWKIHKELGEEKGTQEK